MTNLEKVLSPTEKKNSKIIDAKGKSISLVLDMIITLKSWNQNEKYGKIVRVVLINDDIIKLQSYDNGTPYIIVLDSSIDIDYLEHNLKMFYSAEKLDVKKIEI